jgi:hypothetical protein
VIGEFVPIQPIGAAMDAVNDDLKPDRSGTVSRAFITSANGDTSRRLGNILAVTLDGDALNADRIFRSEPPVQDSVTTTFGKAEKAADAWPDKIFL